MVNTPITRQEVADLLTKLGHDPEEVGRVVIEPHALTVEYVHPLIGTIEKEKG